MSSDLKQFIRAVPDHPKPGVQFYDITTLLLSPEGMKMALDRMEAYVRTKAPDLLVGIESRGFLFGAVLADRMGLGIALCRKAGKLPGRTVAASYNLEYGADKVEMHADAVQPGQSVVLVDDLLATGGTVAAACSLVEKLGGKVVGISTVIELSYLPWREKLSGRDVDFLVSYDSE
jgi:adenine phosphoribosyltransferase